MVNQRLRGAMLTAGMTAAALAEAVEVDIKSVRRWLAEDRIPYPITRIRVAHALDQQESFLWPFILDPGGICDTALREIDGIWPTRSSITPQQWHHLFDQATECIDILVYAGEFLVETLDLADVLAWKAAQGTSIRILIGDPCSRSVKQRAEELQEPWLPDRCRAIARALAEIGLLPGVKVFAHDTPLYSSHFRFDNTLLISTHAFATTDSRSPVTRYRSAATSHLFDFFARAYDRVWQSASSSRSLGPDCSSRSSNTGANQEAPDSI